jgi:ketosteroid isomerase-like protein
MYKTIVDRKVRSIFAEINSGNYQAMIDGLAPTFEYKFLGDHPLSGRRTQAATMNEWWQRISRLLPGGRFTIHQVIVQGHPLNTRIAVRSTISGLQPNGEIYSNDVMQFMRLRLGKLTHVETMEDTAKFERYLATLDPILYPDAVALPLDD